jgi:predicted amino acid dehydrogenase
LILNKNLSKRKIEFAFVVHPRNTNDIFRKYKFLKILPKRIVNGILMVFWPTYGGNIKVETKNGIIWGAIIIAPLTGKQMLRHRKIAAYRVYLAAKLAHIYGANVVGLGALTSVVTDGGVYVDKKTHNSLHLTSGNSLTVATTVKDILRIIKEKNIMGPISIIGATGSIGKGITKMLDQDCDNDLILIGKNKERTFGLSHELSRENVVCTTDIQENNKAEVVIVTTSATGAILDHHILKNAKIIYDITQPKNTPEHIINGKEISYIDGGLIQLPENVQVGMDIGLPAGIAFSCLSETILLAVSKKYFLKSEKDLKVESIRELSQIAEDNNFNSYLTQNGNK